MAEYEALLSGAASSLFHRRGSRDGQLEWCGNLEDRRHWACTRVRDNAATPIVVGDFAAVGQVPNELSQRRQLADLPAPTIVFGGRRRHLQAARGRHVLGVVRAGDSAVLLGALGQDVGLIYVPAGGSPQLLHACPPLALTCFDVDRVVKDRSCADVAAAAGGPQSQPRAARCESVATSGTATPSDATTTGGTATPSRAATTSGPPPPGGTATASDATTTGGTSARTPRTSSGPTASDAMSVGTADDAPDLAVPVRTPAKVRLEHRRTVHGYVGTGIGPTVPEAIVNAFHALVDRARLYVPEDGKKALGIEDVERVVAYFLQLCEIGCRDIGGMSGKLHKELCGRLRGFDVPRYALARVLELLHKVGTCIIVKLSTKKWGLRFVGLNDPTSEHHQRFVAETETMCRFPLPSDTEPPTPRGRRRPARRQEAGKSDGATRRGPAGAPAGPRAEQAGPPREESVLRDTSRPDEVDGQSRGRGDAAASAGGRGEQLELLLGGAEAEVCGDDLPPREVEVDAASELRAALNELAELLLGPGRECAAPASGGEVGVDRPEAHVERRDDGNESIGHERDEGPAREASDALDDVVHRLLDLGATGPTTGAVAEDELTIEQRLGAGQGHTPGAEITGGQSDAQDVNDGPPHDEAQDAAGDSDKLSREDTACWALAGGARELSWACDSECRRDPPSCDAGRCPELGDFEGIVELGRQPCDDAVRERQLLVLERVEREGGDGRSPAPPVLDFRVALARRALSREAALPGGVSDAAPAMSSRSSSWSPGSAWGPHWVCLVAGEGARGLSLLGPRGPPRRPAR